MTLSRDAILGHKDTRIGRVDVPELGGEVCIANFTVLEADKIKTLGDGGVPMVVEIVILGTCDEKGGRLFKAEDGEALCKLPAIVIGRMANAILEHNGLTAKTQEEVKNASSETESGDSVSASPDTSAAPSKN